MLDGLDHVGKAAQILASENAFLKDRLKKAAGEFFVSMVQPGEWPCDLRVKAERLDRKLQNIENMDDPTARQVAGELLDLSFDVACAFRTAN
jgi:hypothetical protein